jgi:peroxiredoxin
VRRLDAAFHPLRLYPYSAKMPSVMAMLKPGDKAPAFRLPADEGSEISLSDFRGKRVVLFFFPKANTPG